MAKLTAKQNKFIDGVVSGLSQSEAYRQAYNASKMKPETIAVKASNLANQDNIRVIIQQRQKELADKAIWSREQALRELSKIGSADIKDFLAFRTEKTVVDYDPETGEPIVGYKQIVDLMNSNDVDGSLISEISISKDGTLKFKLHDKTKAIEMANKMCGYNEPSKVDLSGALKIELGDELSEWAK